MITRPHGIILVTGPTGSGKTTTLYAALTRLNDRSRNIMTVEDPIEYALDGVGQMQVNARIDLTFARGLRAILRQDPDVIMVGEIRDHETAEVAVRASMTGHLVLSTLHTNSAVGSVTRLIDMGVERYLLAPMLSGLIAQRLVRRLCPALQVARRGDRGRQRDDRRRGPGRRPHLPARRLPRAAGARATRAGSASTRSSRSTREMQQAIHDGAAEADLIRLARQRGPGLLEDGAAKALAGETSVAGGRPRGPRGRLMPVFAYPGRRRGGQAAQGHDRGRHATSARASWSATGACCPPPSPWPASAEDRPVERHRHLPAAGISSQDPVGRDPPARRP